MTTRLAVIAALAALAMLGALRPAAGENKDIARGEVEGFALEIPDENGMKRAILEGTKATFDPEGAINITDVKAKIFQKDQSDVIVTTPKAKYHRNSKVVTTDDPVKIDSKDSHITGTGLIWEPDKQQIVIKDHPRVVLKNVDMPKPQLPGGKSEKKKERNAKSQS